MSRYTAFLKKWEIRKKKKFISVSSNEQNLQSYNLKYFCKKCRNWTKAESNLFCETLVDPINSDVKQEALKKPQQKEVYDAIAAEMNEAMKAEPFLSRNAVCYKDKGDLVPLDIDHKRLQTKYNNTEQQWRQISD